MIKGARSSAVVALLVIVAGLTIAACGSSSSSSSASASSAAATSTSATGTTTTGRGGAFASITATQRSCLKAKGVTLPTGGGRHFGGGTGTGTFTRPTGTPPGGGTSTTGAPGGGFGGAGGPGGAGGGFGGGGFSKFATAAKACGVTLGTGRFGGGGFAGRGGTAKVTTAALKEFVACVDKNGYKLTGVNTSGTGAVLSKSLQTNPKFLAAAKSCTQYLRPAAAAPTVTTTAASS